MGSPTREVPHLTTFVLECQVLKCRWLCLWSTQGSGGEGVPVWAGEDRGTEVLVFAHTEVLVGGYGISSVTNFTFAAFCMYKLEVRSLVHRIKIRVVS